jgi:hypothetical protein
MLSVLNVEYSKNLHHTERKEDRNLVTTASLKSNERGEGK